MQDKRTTWKREGMATTPCERERERRSAQRGRERVCSVSSDLFAGVYGSCRRFARATSVCTLALEGTTLRHFCIYFLRDFVYRSVCARFRAGFKTTPVRLASRCVNARKNVCRGCCLTVIIRSDYGLFHSFSYVTCVLVWYIFGTRCSAATMKLEYPCRVEGWLNVCGKYDFFIFLLLFQAYLSYTRYFVISW